MFFLLAQRGKTAHMVVVTVQGAPLLLVVAVVVALAISHGDAISLRAR